jgi:hypothetical protein
MMKKLVGNVMSVALEVIMWITLIACVVAGVSIMGSGKGGSPVLGFVIGTLGGIIINILVWGVISLLVEIRDYLKEITEIDWTATIRNAHTTKSDDTATKSNTSDTKNVNLDMNSLLRK